MKFIADSCSNFSLPAVDGEVSINTPTNSSRLLFSSLEGIDLLLHFVYEHREIILRQAGNELPFLIFDCNRQPDASRGHDNWFFLPRIGRWRCSRVRRLRR